MNRLSTRTRFVLAAILLITPILIIATILLNESFKRSEQQLIINEFATADVVAASVGELISGQLQSLQVLAEEEAIRAIDQRPDEAIALLDGYRLSRPAINGLFLLGGESPIVQGGIDLDGLGNAFDTAANTALTGGQQVISDSLLLPSIDVEVIAIIVPVYANADPEASEPAGTPTAQETPVTPAVSGALGAFYSVERLVLGFTPQTGFATGSDIAIALVTQSGKLVSIPGKNTDPSQVFQDGDDLDNAISSALGNQRTRARFVDPTGLERVVAAVPIPLVGNRWAVLVSGPETTEYGPNRMLINRALLALIGVVVLTVVIASFLGSWLTRPFRLLSDQASALSSGKSISLLESSVPSDAARLSATIRDMADRLHSQVRDTESAREEIARQAERLRDLLRRTVRLQEDERRRIASDIHDAVSPLITGAMYQAQAVRIAQTNGNGHGGENGNGSNSHMATEDTLTGLKEVGELLERAMRELHDVIFDLRPPDLDDIGIVAALQRHVDQINRSGFPCSLQVTGIERRLSPEVRLAIYRIVQESIHNAMRHARADESVVHLEWIGDRLKVTVQDDGSGFDQDSAGRRAGLGLMSMRERAASIGASFEILSRPGSGTAVIVEREINDLDLALEPGGSSPEVDDLSSEHEDSDDLATLEDDEEQPTSDISPSGR